MSQHPPLNYENSLYPTTNHHISSSLPPEVVQCLKNARFLHLATISKPVAIEDPPTPHVSLMNYTFLPSYNDQGPVILMTTNTQSLKTQNLRHNPRVSLLVHDWSSHRPPTAAVADTEPSTGVRSGSPPATATRSSLASLLLNLNTSALSSISTTISGEARFVEPGTEEEKWCKEAHLQNNTFEGQLSTEAGYFGAAGGPVQQPGETPSGYIEGNDVRVVLVPIRKGRISDFKGGVRDWKLTSAEDEAPAATRLADTNYPPQDNSRGRNEGQMNGIVDQDEHI